MTVTDRQTDRQTHRQTHTHMQTDLLATHDPFLVVCLLQRQRLPNNNTGVREIIITDAVANCNNEQDADDRDD